MSDAGSGYWQRVEEIFHRALDMPPDARAAFLGEYCGGSADLEREVREILSSYDAQDRLDSAHADASIENCREGSRFGAFEIVRKIGEGGMGAVYLARRRGDFEQRAAIKLINGTPAAAALMAERFHARAPDSSGPGAPQHRAAAGWRRHQRRPTLSGDGVRGRRPAG